MIDGTEVKNKAMGDEPVKPTSVTAKTALTNEYHFPGTPTYKPLSVVASSLEEATKTWEDKRQLVEEKVEEQTNTTS